MKLQKRKCKNYIVIGTVHLGADVDVLNTIKTAADYYDAEIIHVGPLADRIEVDMHRRREKRLRTWEKHDVEKEHQRIAEIGNNIKELKKKKEEVQDDYSQLTRKKSDQKAREKLKKMKSTIDDKLSRLKEDEMLCWERLGNDRERLEEEYYELLNAQRSRVDMLYQIFGDRRVHFVSNHEVMIPDGELIQDIMGDDYHSKYWAISKHLIITSVPANGDKVSGQPITQRTFRMLKSLGHSHIIPHMTPQTKAFPRPGLNQAFNFITTGSLKFPKDPNKISDAYQASARTSCILVSLDEENGEFHPQRLRVKKRTKNGSPFIIHDGMLYMSDGSYEEFLPSEKAVHFTDAHAPHVHEGVVGAIRGLNTLHEPSTLVDGGDMGNMESVSRFTKNKPGQRENLRIINDLMSIRKFWNAVADGFETIEEKWACGSNHMDWVDLFVDENPSLKGMLDIASLSKSYFPDWNILLRNKSDDQGFVFGNLNIKHGDDESSVLEADDIFGNYLGGHHHRYCEFEDAIFAGPACRVDHRIHKYLKNKATSWQNNVTTITKYGNITCKHPKIILHSEDERTSRFCYRGEIYEVDFFMFLD